jgi:hypothetical protein
VRPAVDFVVEDAHSGGEMSEAERRLSASPDDA